MPPKIGSRKEVWLDTAQQTSSGLTKNDLMKNKSGKIVSKKLSHWAKEKKPLGKHLATKN